MRLTDNMEEVRDELIDEATDWRPEFIEPDDDEWGYDLEWYLESLIEGVMQEVVREVTESGIESDTSDCSYQDPLRSENVEQIHITQKRYRGPFIAIELNEIPEYAKITRYTEVFVRPSPGRTERSTAAGFQVRKYRS